MSANSLSSQVSSQISSKAQEAARPSIDQPSPPDNNTKKITIFVLAILVSLISTGVCLQGMGFSEPILFMTLTTMALICTLSLFLFIVKV